MSTSNISKQRTRKKGFTLLEIIISFALISILIIPMANMILSTVKMNKMGENKQQAKVILQDTVESIKSESKLPSAIGESTDLVNGVRVEKDVDITDVSGEHKSSYIVASSNENSHGFSINGTIKESSVVISNDINKGKIDRAIYFNNGYMSISNGSSEINSAIERDFGDLQAKGESISIDISATGAINIVYGEIQNRIDIANPVNDALLICLDDTTNKLKVNINSNGKNKLKIYLHKKGGASERNDVVLSEFKGNIELITGIVKASEVKNGSIYSAELTAKKNNQIIETMNFDFIK
ncbi:MAG: prepilin-type N-terminal cleavage/methylation domain-containing protein [Clostridium sp.]|uniref:type IV pilus modification PilV family protein n=1 Tax=Clostridium sp. TaxID=1506 RepID=UPI003041081C